MPLLPFAYRFLRFFGGGIVLLYRACVDVCVFMGVSFALTPFRLQVEMDHFFPQKLTMCSLAWYIYSTDSSMFTELSMLFFLSFLLGGDGRNRRGVG